MQNNLAGLCKALEQRAVYRLQERETNLYRDNFNHLIICHCEGKTASLSHFLKSCAGKFPHGHLRKASSIISQTMFTSTCGCSNPQGIMRSIFHNHWSRCCGTGSWGIVGWFLWTQFPPLPRLMQRCADESSPKAQNNDWYVTLKSANIWNSHMEVHVKCKKQRCLPFLERTHRR